ncbi:helix-turn-helix domain-containing protein [Patulibacter minatonensis]|uniref:helix-turn-helix domain-containing protein n=1 Tax=Patulibacter minatonensis TaxID=298163 RepID=UPI00047BFB12|nr:GAF domain-containing protein [Patulibacter minatonensis]
MSGHVHASRAGTDPGPRGRGGPQVLPASGDDAALVDGTLGRDWLYRVIGAVAQGPDVDGVLPAVVELLSDATACHACFVYLRDHDRLTMRAASKVFADAVGRVSFGVDEGLCGWVVRHDRPAFIREDALSDPRMKLVPELQEERFQSMVAVPLRGRDGVVIGVIVLHTEAPREFGQEVLDFLSHVASLVAGTIENARLFEREQERVRALDRLALLVQRLATVSRRGDLLTATCDGTLELLAADRCRLHLVDLGDGASRVVASASATGSVVRPQDPPVDAPERGALAVRVAAGDAGEGVLSVEREAPFQPHERGMLETVAAQAAVALRTVELIERLTEENLVRDLFDAIAAGRGGQVAARARGARIDPDGPHVVAIFEPLRPGRSWASAERVETRLRHAVPGALCDPSPERLRVLVPVASGDGRASALRDLDELLDAIAREEQAVGGRSSVQAQLAADRASLVEAAAAARIARALAPEGGLRAWDALGAYRYLVGVGGEVQPDARHAAAVDALWRYDARRGSELVRTLERYLADRSVVPTARALYIHANTLRQRLERIEHLTDLTIAEEDLVSLELAIKLHRLRAPEREAA